MAGNTVMAFLVALGLPSAVTGFFFWLLQKKLTERADEDKEARKTRQEEIDRREKTREEYEFVMAKSVEASLILSEATARAVQRIPDAQCNGDMKAALDKVEAIKLEKQDFMDKQAVRNIF